MIELMNYATMFHDEYSLFVESTTSGRLCFWRCKTCKEQATQETRGSEIVLSCSCRSNYSYGTDIHAQILADVAAVPMEDLELVEDTTEEGTILNSIYKYFRNLFS